MRTVFLPEREKWEDLCKRPEIERNDLGDIVSNILSSVRSGKDGAILSFNKKFGGVVSGNLKVAADEISDACQLISFDLAEAIKTAKRNIEKFHSAQLITEPVIETMRGVRCWRKSVAIEKVGLYIPGGNAPLFSTLLMLGIPAKLAGCKEIIVCTPAGKDGKINPAILYTAQLLDITQIFKVGGAQAIAAMAYGTESIPKVNKIFGPGNQYVTRAKELIQLDGISIDMPAGPSEVLVIADKNADAAFVASDLLAQAEHGPDSQVILLTDDEDLIGRVKSEIQNQVEVLPRKDIAEKALENSMIILLPSLEDCIDYSNIYAPEHLIINTSDANSRVDNIINAGSVFIGNLSCESAGDYASGTNHTLPTNRFARSYSGVSVDSFLKKITFQEITSSGMLNLGPTIEIMAEAESLAAHRNAVSIRIKSLKK